jgi:phosphoribosylaminoimidazole carboxylase (NCAIR synthetase)
MLHAAKRRRSSSVSSSTANSLTLRLQQAALQRGHGLAPATAMRILRGCLARKASGDALLEKLDQGRRAVHPPTATLRTLQDPALQKAFLKSKGLPVADARPADARDVSVIGARGVSGEIRAYPLAENLYADGVLRTTIVPARIDPVAAADAERVAAETLRALEGAGVFCVEMFVDPKGAVLVNQVSPRVHNSGYYTIEACRTSQFEQHVRAITGMALGETTLLYSAVVVKILGAPGRSGPVVLEGVDAVRCVPGASVHLYGRSETAPGRVLGHVTLVDVLDPAYRDALIHRADHVRTMIIQKESRT